MLGEEGVRAVACVSTEVGGRVVVAAIADVVGLQRVVILELPSAMKLG